MNGFYHDLVNAASMKNLIVNYVHITRQKFPILIPMLTHHPIYSFHERNDNDSFSLYVHVVLT